MSTDTVFLGDGSIWDTIKKEKIGTFVSNNKVAIVTINQQIIAIKEERKLMNRLLVASRTRPDIDLQFCLGKYEFSVTPPSLFSPDGSLHSTKDKSVIAEELFKFQVDEEIESELMDTDIRKVAVVDGMAFVNKVSIKKNRIRNCEKFASCFIDIIDKENAEYHEVHIAFDHYQKNSLKGNTRATHAKRYSAVHYKVSDATKIDHLETKYFLSSIETRKELSQYLSLKLSQHFVKHYVVVFDKTVLTNMPDLDNNLRNYNHEETDTGIVLHALDVSKRDPFSELVVFCSDTDVLLILLHYFDDKLSSSTIFKTINREFVQRKIYENVAPQCLQSFTWLPRNIKL